MLLPRPFLRRSSSFLFNSLPQLHPRPPQSLIAPNLQIRTKLTISQILRGGRIPPKRKQIHKSESPDLKQNPFKKAVVQKVYIVKPKVSILI